MRAAVARRLPRCELEAAPLEVVEALDPDTAAESVTRLQSQRRKTSAPYLSRLPRL